MKASLPERHHAPTATRVCFHEGECSCPPYRQSLTWRTWLVTVAAAGAVGLVLLAAPGDAQTVPSADAGASGSGLGTAAEDRSIRPFTAPAYRKRRSMTFAGASPPRGGPTRKPLPISRRACSWPGCRSWSATGAAATTGARRKRSSMRLPQFTTNIDGVDIHFIHVRSRHTNALPLIITHGWPGSVIEQLKIIGPLTDPTAYGGRAEDAFDVVIPSMPGYGFSGKPTGTGWDPDRIAQAWAELMKRLGYTRYVAQGGDWGSPVCNSMARQAPKGLLGIHVNLPATVPPDVAAVIPVGGPAPAGLSEEERAVFETLVAADKMGNRAYVAMMTARPQNIGYGVTDSPAGLAAWLLGHPGFAKWTYGSRSRAVANEGRRAGQHHAVLADKHRRLRSAHVLGERRTRPHERGRPEERRDLAPGGHHGIPGRGLPIPGDLGAARLSPT